MSGIASRRNRIVFKGLLSTAFLAAGAHSDNVRIFNTASIYNGFNFLRGFRLLVRLVTCINEIDDIVDNLPAEERLKLGEATLGNTACGFLKNERLSLAPYFETVRRLDRAGIISENESISFSNIYATLLTQSAEVEANLEHGNDFEGRKKLTKLNMKTAQILGAHVLQHAMPSSAIKEKADNSNLSAEDALEAFPEAMRFGYLIEMCDDLEDFLVDMKREVNTGIKTPNWIATSLAKSGVLYAPDTTDIVPELQTALREYGSNAKSVPFDSLPKNLKQAIMAGQQHLLDSAASLPNMQRKLIQMWWDTLLSSGIQAPACCP